MTMMMKKRREKKFNYFWFENYWKWRCFPPKKGRPFGGSAFLVHKKFLNIKFEFINNNVAYLTIKHNVETITFIATYLPYDNGTHLNLVDFQSNLQIVNETYYLFHSRKHIVVIIGDFNAHAKRGKRFDNIFCNSVENNNFRYLSDSLNVYQYSYSNTNYKACIDHCLISNDYSNNNFNIQSHFLNNDENLSDHKPISVKIDLTFCCQTNTTIEEIEPKFYTKLPNLENEEIKKKFNDFTFIIFSQLT